MRGHKLEKLLSNHKAQFISWHIYAPLGVFLLTGVGRDWCLALVVYAAVQLHSMNTSKKLPWMTIEKSNSASNGKRFSRPSLQSQFNVDIDVMYLRERLDGY